MTKNIMDWNKISDNGTSFHGWRLDGVLLNLLRPEGAPEVSSWPRKRTEDWNKQFDDPEAGAKLRGLLKTAAGTECENSCGYDDCIHNAARAILGLQSVVEHDPECETCKQIREGRRIIDVRLEDDLQG